MSDEQDKSGALQRMWRSRWTSPIVGLTLVLLCASWLWLAVERAREAAQQSSCNGHAFKLTIALFEYHDYHRTYPPAVVTDDQGRPMHSWRILILPFIHERETYEQYNFDEPWNGPNNRKLANKMPQYFRCASAPENSTETNYVAVVGPETAWAGTSSRRKQVVGDGPDKTVMVVEIAHSGINWMEPRDLTFEQALRGVNASGADLAISSLHRGGAFVCFCEGHARFIRNDIKPETLRALLTANGGEKVVATDDGSFQIQK